LDKYKISSKNIDLERLNAYGIQAEYIHELTNLRDNEGKVKIGLKRGFELLAQLGNPIGTQYMNDKELQNLLAMRNNSILAHGIKPISKQGCEELWNRVLWYGQMVFNDQNKLTLDDLIRKSQFIRLE
jgi:hypothetical protein